VWRAQIGRIPIFFLDANLEENSPDDKAITSQLYGGDIEMRIRQDIMLGIGGVRALKALGLNPTVFHINEGHAAFLALERIRILMEERGLSFEEAREVASAGNVFTTHTPLPSGIDAFPQDLMEKYFSHYYQSLGISREDFLSLGRLNPDEPFNMAILALRLSSYRNGVSKLHGRVTRRIWKGVWPGVPNDEVPIHSITNGIHPLSWVSYEMASLFDHYLGPRWRWNPADPSVWEGVEDIPDEELWLTHERRRERLIAFARRKLKAQLERQGAPPRDIEMADEVLNPEALTIGFGRRFTSYKRHTLILRNPERLSRILNDKDRPVQLIFAGKAHPRDHQAKEMLKQLIQLARQGEFRRRIVFIEDYDMCVARFMVQGADVWLNTPRRFQEASGTSGMKAAANGVLNMSILDGWWDEAYKRGIGWAIGRGEVYDDYNYQDDIESNAIYDLLEKEVIPLFYERGSDGLPRKWISMMKESIRSICPYFNTDRMVREYVEKFYLPASSRYRELQGFGAERAKALAKWKAKVHKNWSDISILSVEADVSEGLEVGSVFEVCARVYLGQLTPEDVSVELYFGSLDPSGEFVSGEAIHMTCTGSQEGAYTFSGSISCRRSGRYGYTLRILPKHDDLVNPYELGLILWA
jgi:starch phosphorylase